MHLQFRHYVLPVAMAVVSIVMMLLTIAYASRWITFSVYHTWRSSRRSTLLILRVLSEITTLSLGATTSLVLERLQWFLISRKQGQPLLSFLGLSPGTGILGLSRLTFRRGRVHAKWRWWSISRLAIIAALPIMNVIIFAGVSTDRTYSIEATKEGDFNMGLGGFNASVLQAVGPITDSMLGMEIDTFLSDARFVLDITPTQKQGVACTLGISKTSSQNCGQSFYMPGTFGDFDLLKNGTFPQADLIVVHDIRGLQLDFSMLEPDAGDGFDVVTDCQVYGNDVTAFQVCFRDVKDTIIMGVNACLNATVLAGSRCLKDKIWRTEMMSTSSVKIMSRTSTVGFSRLNSTIQTYELRDDHEITNVRVRDLESAFKSFFAEEDGRLLKRKKPTVSANESASDFMFLVSNITNDLSLGITGDPIVAISSGTPSYNKKAPTLVALYFAMSHLMYSSAGAASRNAIGLQSLVAKLIWWCSIPAPSLLPGGEVISPAAASSFNLTDFISKNSGDTGESSYSLARSTYQITVSKATIILFTVLALSLLLFCISSLLVCILHTDEDTRIPEASSFPDMDYRGLDIDGLPRLAEAQVIDLAQNTIDDGIVRLPQTQQLLHG